MSPKLADSPASGGRLASLPGLSIGTKLALVVVLVLGIASAVIGLTLSQRAQQSIIDSKAMGAAMVMDLFAASIVPVLDFDDEEALRTETSNLKVSRDVTYAAVWKQDGDAPVVELGTPTQTRARPSPGNQTYVRSERIELTREVIGPAGTRLGAVVVYFSLAPENAAANRMRTRIAWMTLGIATLLAGLVIAVARQQVVVPLNRVARAVKRLESGERVQVDVQSSDEVGNLARAFNAMAAAILDREQRLEALNRRLQQLLDHMHQAIVVFGEGGTLDNVRSRHAEEVFGRSALEEATIWQLVYPDDPRGVEAQALEEWVAVAVGVPVERWDELAPLAPSMAVLSSGKSDERVLSLEFRPIVEAGEVLRVMLLATDETEKRRLERAVEQQGAEHARQMAAMRRLIAGGGQLLVRVLDNAKQRLKECRAVLERTLSLSDAEAMFHHVHTLKGEGRAFDLGALEAETALFEDKIVELRRWLREESVPPPEPLRRELAEHLERSERALAGAADLLIQASPIGPAILEQVTVRRTDLEALLERVRGRDGHLIELVERLASRPFGESTFNLSEAVVQWAARLGKRARLEIEGGDVMVPPQVSRVLPGILTHLVRNAVAHGIERPEIRARAGKPATGLVRLVASDEQGLTILVEDDGSGLDSEAIQARALALGLDGSSAATELALAHGLTTFDSAESLAGHGVGLSAVKAEVAALGWRLELTSDRARGTRCLLRA